ncbi:MAG TPA: nucleotide-binding protein [Chlamydiales bacterium]|nr:nucleotide-binding protein [Chlamydiales bacterium]
MPVEIIEVGNIPTEWVDQALSLAHSVQNEFSYLRLAEADAQHFQIYVSDHVKAPEFMDSMEEVRSNLRGFHPYLLAFIDAELDGEDYSNIFGSNRGEKGIGVLTIANVPSIIIAPDRMSSYLLYYLARYTLSYIVPKHKNHDETRGCVYDRKINKLDLLESMKARSICKDCRTSLLSSETALSPRQFIALDKMFDMSGKILEGSLAPKGENKSLPRAFVGSSSEGLEIANKVQALLEYDLDSEIWNQGTIFGLGEATLEALEQAVLAYDFAIFIFTPDDQLHTRGEFKPVARDNVVLELGLFIGKLTRRRAFVIHPAKKAIALPSDLAGITMATYDPDKANLAAALGPACQKIREAVKRILSQ